MSGADTHSHTEHAEFAWTHRAPVAKIVAALETRARGASRFVGGCVRDSLVGAEPKDIDIATTLKPDEVVAALGAAGLSSAPTGIEHGTVTGIADHVGVEITTLRADVSTDGRRATVAFTNDWAIDAGRRDFRLNAIYLDFEGRLHDPVGGVADARAGRVRFIGAAEDRIREDYLRILRFFRFSARFARGFDAEGLAACAALASGMDALSAERVGGEFMRLLDFPGAPLAVDAMAASAVLREVWPAAPDRHAFRRLKDYEPSAPAPLGLAALFGRNDEGLDRRLRLSRAEGSRRKKALAAEEGLRALDVKGARARIYEAGVGAYPDGLALARARCGVADWKTPWGELVMVPSASPPPAFRLSGKDAIALGLAPGPDVAAAIDATEARWIAEDFPPTARARHILAEEVSTRLGAARWQ